MTYEKPQLRPTYRSIACAAGMPSETLAPVRRDDQIKNAAIPTVKTLPAPGALLKLWSVTFDTHKSVQPTGDEVPRLSTTYLKIP